MPAGKASFTAVQKTNRIGAIQISGRRAGTAQKKTYPLGPARWHCSSEMTQTTPALPNLMRRAKTIGDKQSCKYLGLMPHRALNRVTASILKYTRKPIGSQRNTQSKGVTQSNFIASKTVHTAAF